MDHWNLRDLELLLYAVAEVELIHDGHIAASLYPQLGWLIHLTHDALRDFDEADLPPVVDTLAMVDRLRILLPKGLAPLAFGDYVRAVAIFMRFTQVAVIHDDNAIEGCRLRLADDDPTADSQEERKARWERIIRLLARVAAAELAQCTNVPWLSSVTLETDAGAAASFRWHAGHILTIASVFMFSVGIGYMLCSCSGGVETCVLGHTI